MSVELIGTSIKNVLMLTSSDNVDIIDHALILDQRFLP